MASRKKQTSQSVPEGFTAVDLRPKKIEDLEPGFELLGTLGEVSPGKGDMPPYRAISTEHGRYWLPSHADLRGLLDYAVGTEVYCRFESGNGKKGDPYVWTVAVRDTD